MAAGCQAVLHKTTSKRVGESRDNYPCRGTTKLEYRHSNAHFREGGGTWAWCPPSPMTVCYYTDPEMLSDPSRTFNLKPLWFWFIARGGYWLGPMCKKTLGPVWMQQCAFWTAGLSRVIPDKHTQGRSQTYNLQSWRCQVSVIFT